MGQSGKLANNRILKIFMKEMRVLMDQYGHLKKSLVHILVFFFL